MPVYGKAEEHPGPDDIPYFLIRTAKTATFMGAERNNILAGEIMAFQKSVYRHRHFRPPVRIADKHGVVFRKIIHGTGNGWSCLLPLFLLCEFYKLAVSCRIHVVGNLDFKQRASGFIGNHSGDNLGIALSDVTYGILLPRT